MSVQAEELTNGLTEMFAAEEPPAEPTPEPEPEPPAPAEPVTEPPAEASLEINGRQFRAQELEPYVRFNEWAEANPQVWAELQALETQSQPASQPSEPAPAEEWTDPEERIARLEGQLREFQEERTSNTRAEFLTSLSEGIDQLRTIHPDLDDESLNRVLIQMRDLEVLPAFRKKFPTRPTAAVFAALNTAYRVEFFERGPARQPVTTSEARARRQAASAAPSGSSSPRIPDVPESPEQARIQMISEIREAQNA